MTSNLVNSLLVQSQLESNLSNSKGMNNFFSFSVPLKVSTPTRMRLDKLLSCTKDVQTDDSGTPLWSLSQTKDSLRDLREKEKERERELVGFLLFVLVEGSYSAKENSIIVHTNHFDLICKLTCHDVWPSSHLSLQPIDGLGLCVVISWYGLESWKMSYPPFPCQDMNDYSC